MTRPHRPDARGRSVARSRRARAFRVLAWRGRHVLVSLALGVLAAAVVTAASPPPPPQRAVVVLAHDVVAGEPLEASDLTSTTAPVDGAQPCALTTPGDAVGASPAVDLTRGTHLCPELLVRGTADLPPGTAAVPVRLADPRVAALLLAGTRVDVVVPSTPDPTGDTAAAEGRVLTHDALVLPAPAATEDEGGLLGGTTAAEPVVLLAVRVKDAPVVAASAVSGGLAVVLVG
ncbi:SAF domain-containing protein [Sanguibacter sp. HDW7]|uniref:SAF domain-containing protein n=1 Tax=Sanguibacter sp. HDW7 TaxID=2714931 RepID=UPI00140D6C3B|nr:SAF domain-containing protein [Sanguibacter sp. HDW7]QIK84252.1 flagellar biosynthesis protein FlgA [Sanguibacter sp. HDW7]